MPKKDNTKDVAIARGNLVNTIKAVEAKKNNKEKDMLTAGEDPVKEVKEDKIEKVVNDEPTMAEMIALVKYIAHQCMGSAELKAAKEAFKNIFKD